MPRAVEQPRSLEDAVTDTIPPSQEGSNCDAIDFSSQHEDASQQEEYMPAPPAKKLCVGKKHGLKNKSAKKTTISADHPRNEEEREELKRSGKATMFAHLSLPRGRPKRASEQTNPASKRTEAAADKASEGVSFLPAADFDSKPPAKRGQYINWSRGEHRKAIDVAMNEMANHGDIKKMHGSCQ